MSENLRYRLDRLNGGDFPRGCDFEWSSGRVIQAKLLLEGGLVDEFGPSHTTVKR